MDRILIVEDQPALRRLYQSVLGRAGYQVTVAKTGEEAVVAAADINPDLVLMDLALPGISGVEVARQLAEQGTLPAAGLIITTAFADAATLKAVADMGPSKLLTKPFDINDLLEVVRSSLPKARNQSGGQKSEN